MHLRRGLDGVRKGRKGLVGGEVVCVGEEAQRWWCSGEELMELQRQLASQDHGKASKGFRVAGDNVSLNGKRYQFGFSLFTV